MRNEAAFALGCRTLAELEAQRALVLELGGKVGEISAREYPPTVEESIALARHQMNVAAFYEARRTLDNMVETYVEANPE
jgi:hypothetical protein